MEEFKFKNIIFTLERVWEIKEFDFDISQIPDQIPNGFSNRQKFLAIKDKRKKKGYYLLGIWEDIDLIEKKGETEDLEYYFRLPKDLEILSWFLENHSIFKSIFIGLDEIRGVFPDLSSLESLNEFYFINLEIPLNKSPEILIVRKRKPVYIKKEIINQLLKIIRGFSLEKVILKGSLTEYLKDYIEVFVYVGGFSFKHLILEKETESIPGKILQTLGYRLMCRLLWKSLEDPSLDLSAIRWIEERIKKGFFEYDDKN